LAALYICLHGQPGLADGFDRPGFADRAGAERQERWRAARAGRLRMPLPGTPDTERPLSRLFEAGLSLGAPVMLRIFKAEGMLEVWMEKQGRYVAFATYPICYFSGALGPKLREGDRQAPEGFYTITRDLLHDGRRWQRSLNIGYPNAFDRANGRSGSAILVHGGCDSSGCFAMTDAVNAELYDLVSAALRSGSRHVPVHVFPFRMTDAAISALPAVTWRDFWSDLKLGYDSFERTRLPPHVSVCGKRYRIADATRGGRDPGPIALCAENYETVPGHLVTERARTAQTKVRARSAGVHCSPGRASCRRWVALRERAASRRHVAGAGKTSHVH
jgi:murein L,D-transpeptidase YafK